MCSPGGAKSAFKVSNVISVFLFYTWLQSEARLFPSKAGGFRGSRVTGLERAGVEGV